MGMGLHPYANDASSYANRVDFSGVAVTVQQTVLDVRLDIGQPFTLNVAEVSGNIGPAPIGITGGPTALECFLTQSGGYNTEETVEFTLGRADSFAIQATGPFRLSARPINTTATSGPVLAAWATINPAVTVAWPVQSALEAVPAAFASVAVNSGFPAPYRPYLTLQTNGTINVRFVDRGNNVVALYSPLTAVQCATTFSRFLVDPQLRLQLQTPGGAGAATAASIAWSTK